MLQMERGQNYNFHDKKGQIGLLITKRSPNLNVDSGKIVKILYIGDEKRPKLKCY